MVFIKEVKKEVLDLDAMSAGIRSTKDMLYRNPYLPWCKEIRLVMSSTTRRELQSMFTVRCAFNDGASVKETYEGCPIDINDSLGFGEVKFTVEL